VQPSSRGRQHRREHALGGARGDEHAERAGRTADGRSGREADQPGHERPLAPEQVAEAAAEQQQGAEGQGVGGDDPLARVVGEAEVALGRGQRDVHDRDVEDDHQLCRGDDGECEVGVDTRVPAGAGGGGVGDGGGAHPSTLCHAGEPPTSARRL
jgi:hypothetical protein